MGLSVLTFYGTNNGTVAPRDVLTSGFKIKEAQYLYKQVALNLATNIHLDKRGSKRNKLERQKKAQPIGTSSDQVGTKNVENLMATLEVRLIIWASVAERSALMMPG